MNNSTTTPQDIFISSKMTNVTSRTPEPQDGYDIPVYGLNNRHFAYLHITALSCISVSFAFSIFVITKSYRTSKLSFFRWSKSERFLVYMALCDGFFNIAHSMDHLHIFITQNHPKPRQICTFYAFMIGEFISAQMFMVNIVAINVFSMIFLRKDINFGRYDWRLLTYIFGIPFVVYLVAAILGKLGPTGAFCHFDAIRGTDLYVYYLTVLTFIVVIVNSVLYVVTWIKIYRESRAFANVLGEEAQTIKNIHKSARNMSLFVLVFFIQWFSLAAYSITALVGNVPEVILYMAIVFNNIGGVLNGIVYLIIRRRRRTPEHQKSVLYKSSHTISTNTLSSTQM